MTSFPPAPPGIVKSVIITYPYSLSTNYIDRLSIVCDRFKENSIEVYIFITGSKVSNGTKRIFKTICFSMSQKINGIILDFDKEALGWAVEEFLTYLSGLAKRYNIELLQYLDTTWFEDVKGYGKRNLAYVDAVILEIRYSTEWDWEKIRELAETVTLYIQFRIGTENDLSLTLEYIFSKMKENKVQGFFIYCYRDETYGIIRNGEISELGKTLKQIAVERARSIIYIISGIALIIISTIAIKIEDIIPVSIPFMILPIILQKT